MRRFVGQVAVYALAAPIVGVVVAALASASADRLPQVVKGGDALSVAFADAKETISAAMVHKADSYFHGGIDIDCHAAHGHGHERGNDHGEDHHDHGEPPERAGFDPWRWINQHIRAPERHVHLEGGKSAEMLPWFWAAVRADPHNIDAWTTAWYVADMMMRDKALARRILDEGLARNPGDVELLLCRARMAHDGGKGDVHAARAAFAEARDAALAKCAGDVSRLSERERAAYRFAVDFMTRSKGD